jgi:ubiquinone biosynthesis protein COQ9
MSSDKNNEVKDCLLLAMLPHVVFDGWSLKSLAAGRCDLKGEVLETGLLFPEGMKDVAVHFGDYIAGDKSTDFNYYTKRGLLASIYGLTILYWLSDTSQDFGETEVFLAQRLNSVMYIPKFRSKIIKHLEWLSGPFNFFKRSVF